MTTSRFRLNLLDWQSVDCDYAGIVPSLPFHVDLSFAQATDNYNRALGRTMSYEVRPPGPRDIVFFLDADMLVPRDFCETIEQIVKPGTCYFPICYSLYENKPPAVYLDRRPQHPQWREANGWWRKAGRGNCGFVAADFVKLGGWNAQLRDSWGKEDDEIYGRAQRRLNVIREMCVGLFHQYHEPDPQANTYARSENA